MSHKDNPRDRHFALLAALQIVGDVSGRLPYGISEPLLCGAAAISLYTGGLWRSAEVELWTTEPLALIVALIAEGFLPEDSSAPGGGRLRRADLEYTLSIAATGRSLGSAIATNTVRVVLDLDTAALLGSAASSLRVVGIEDLIADQVVEWIGQRGGQGEAAIQSQVLIELGRMGVGGPFRPAYVQRRLDRETNGEAAFELPRTASPLDDLSPRHTSLAVIASVVRGWRSRRGLFDEADETAIADTQQAVPIGINQYRYDLAAVEGRSTSPTARIFPFSAPGRSKPVKR
jgi:hypothetical protein